MNANQIMIEIDKLLQKWELYSMDNRIYIEKIFRCQNYDMILNIEVLQNQARMYMKERGEIVYEYRTDKKEEIIYAVFEYIIYLVTEKAVWDMFADEKGHLHYTEAVTSEKNRMKDEAFSLMGEPYYEWYKQGKDIWDYVKN